uniref:Candidate secreted effector n=1 Tax=Meloidogyne incognita TaxID=6306 RepID=A0A914N0T0_MELIC
MPWGNIVHLEQLQALEGLQPLRGLVVLLQRLLWRWHSFLNRCSWGFFNWWSCFWGRFCWWRSSFFQ